MRVNARWASVDRFTQEIPASTQSPMMRAFKQLHYELQSVTDLSDVDTVTYLLPFVMVIESERTSGFITGAAISAINKFLLYGLITCESLRADVAINRIAVCISRCRFEETHRADDEAVLMKLLELVEYCVRCDAGHLISGDNLWKMLQLCYSIRCQPRSSMHLCRSADNTLSHLVLTVFDRIDELEPQRKTSQPLTPMSPQMQQNGAEEEEKEQIMPRLISPTENEEMTCVLGLRLINVVLETAGTGLGNHPCLVSVLQGDLSKFLLQNSETEELGILSLTLRVVFNLFNSIKDHLKVQLEVFFTSVHMRIIDSPSCSDEQKELALESLLEFCREPALMLDLLQDVWKQRRCIKLKGSDLARFTAGASPRTESSSDVFPREDISPMSSVRDLMHLVMSGSESDSDSEQSESDNPADQLAWLHTARERTAEVLQQRKSIKKRYALAAEKFNHDQKNWMAFSQQIGLLPEKLTPESVASFLLHTPGLNKTLIGDYIGDGPIEKYPFNAAVRDAYVAMFDFRSAPSLDEALRMFLAKFRLPGEAQKIDRMMEAFSKQFYLQAGSSGPLADADAAFVLAFSIIMLNTDLHSDHIAKKMTIEEFIRNNRGINAGQDLPTEYLTDLYYNILEKEIQMQHDVSDFMEAPSSTVDRYSMQWDGVLKRSENVVGASFTSNTSILKLRAGLYEKDMFNLISESTIKSILLAFEKTCDLNNMERALEGLSNCAKIMLYYEHESAETIGERIVRRQDDGSEVEVLAAPQSGASIDEDLVQGAKTRRALLALKLLFQFVQNKSECFRKVPLPPMQGGASTHAPSPPKMSPGRSQGGTGLSGKTRERSRRQAERQAAIRSRMKSMTQASQGTAYGSHGQSVNSGSFWDSLSSYLWAEQEKIDESFSLVNQMLREEVMELGGGILEKENWLRLTRKLQEKSLTSLLETLISCRDPFKCIMQASDSGVDAMMQENAILVLELSVDIILVNSHRILQLNLWDSFHLYAKRILSTPLGELHMQGLVERVVVHILRDMYKALSDRLASGITMLLKANLVYMHDFRDWEVLLGILQNVVEYINSRSACWESVIVLAEGGHLKDDNFTPWMSLCCGFVRHRTSYAVDALKLLQGLANSDNTLPRLVAEGTAASGEEAGGVKLAHVRSQQSSVVFETTLQSLYNLLLVLKAEDVLERVSTEGSSETLFDETCAVIDAVCPHLKEQLGLLPEDVAIEMPATDGSEHSEQHAAEATADEAVDTPGEEEQATGHCDEETEATIEGATEIDATKDEEVAADEETLARLIPEVEDQVEVAPVDEPKIKLPSMWCTPFWLRIFPPHFLETRSKATQAPGDFADSSCSTESTMSSETSSIDKSELVAVVEANSESAAPYVKVATTSQKKNKKSKTKVKAVVAAVASTQELHEAESMSNLTVDHPYLSVLYKRIRSHRKKLEKIKSLEQAQLKEGKKLNAQQQELMGNKSTLEKLVAELEMLREQFVGVFSEELEKKKLQEAEEEAATAMEPVEQEKESEQVTEQEEPTLEAEQETHEVQETVEQVVEAKEQDFANVYELLKTLHVVNLHQALGKEVPMVLDFFSKVLLGNTRPPAELSYEENLMESLEEAKKYLADSDKIFACDTTYSGLRVFVDQLANISSEKEEVEEEAEKVAEEPVGGVKEATAEEASDVPVVPAEINTMPQISFFTESQLESEQGDEAAVEQIEVIDSQEEVAEVQDELVEEVSEDNKVLSDEQVDVQVETPESVPPLSFAAVTAGVIASARLRRQLRRGHLATTRRNLATARKRTRVAAVRVAGGRRVVIVVVATSPDRLLMEASHAVLVRHARTTRTAMPKAGSAADRRRTDARVSTVDCGSRATRRSCRPHDCPARIRKDVCSRPG
ncbi:Guanine nucleotide exchange factor, N-terminal [Phytophthora cactorum]|nr:Guanine nucleotide exchange factor, N-terminal [Phytophthora cactorum]